jgi:DeoR/GlpR family transcriptional regulator of sugar metabolism
VTYDLAFLGADGVVAGRGLCEATAEQAFLKECIVAQAASVFVLVTSDKLGRASQQHWTPLERVWTLITDSLADPAAASRFTERGNVTVERAESEAR